MTRLEAAFILCLYIGIPGLILALLTALIERRRNKYFDEYARRRFKRPMATLRKPLSTRRNR